MTQNEHNLVALVVLFIIHQIIYHTILKHHPVAKKNMEELSELVNEFFK